ncbi:Leucine-rich repeat domain superfamily [Sesbania bispinosa]|nr:Leucine-rich repeat domain superfamily [Sesbania bispinosa]
MASSSKTTYKEAEGETRDWLALPTNVTAIILQKLDTFDLVTTACLVCPEWFDIWKDPLTWRTIRITKYGNSPSDLAENVCRYAIDGSCGQAEDISITNFGSDDLLKYIGDRSAIPFKCYH